MVGRMAHRLVAGGILAMLGAITGAIVAVAGHANGPNLITISGDGLSEPIEVAIDQQPELFAALHNEVSWLVGHSSQGGKPEDQETLGPVYELTVHLDDKPRHRFKLYPLADGGPRAHRPAKQPNDREVKSGWFYGRLSMPDTLAAAGVPVHGEPDTGGVGGGATTPESSASPTSSALSQMVDDWWTGMRIAGAVTGAIVIGVAVTAFAIRRAT